MLTIVAALTVLLAIPETTTPVKKTAPAPQPAAVTFNGSELVRTIKTDLESIAGHGTVTVSLDPGAHYTVRIAIPGFSSKVCSQIYDREQALRELFPDLNIDFYFSTPELTRAIKADLESISGRGTVDISIDSKTLFNVRIAIAGYSSDLYRQLYDRELELYRALPELSFDFYLRPVS
jgi:hypothetical protein